MAFDHVQHQLVLVDEAALTRSPDDSPVVEHNPPAMSVILLRIFLATALDVRVRGQHRASRLLRIAREVRPADPLFFHDLDVRVGRLHLVEEAVATVDTGAAGLVMHDDGDFTGLAELTEQLCATKEPVYLTIDLDCLDPSCFPGTGTPEAGGVSFLQLLDAIRTVSKANIVGADLNELAPMLDISGVSTATACKVLRELLIALDKGWPGFQV